MTWINHESQFAWQAQYLVMLEGNPPRIVHDVSYVTRINPESQFAWEAQYLVKLQCHSSWQVQHLVKFGMIAGARNALFLNRKCSWRARQVTSVARPVAD